MATRREDLEQLRERLLGSLLGDEIEPQQVAAVSRELRALWVDLEGLPVPESTAPADEIARRRAARRQAASG